MSNHGHEILVVKQYPSGAEEWLCPGCGRRFIVQWTPEYRCVVLDAGDEVAIHNMSKGALVVPSCDDTDALLRMAPWMEWLTHVDLESQLGEETPLD